MIVSLAAALALLSSCQTMPASGWSISVADQRAGAGAVAVARVLSAGPGWLVIHGDAGGAPGPVLGWVPVREGVNRNLRIRVDPTGATPYLWAMLHADSGALGRYEFPGPDGPVTVDGRVVMKRFRLDQGYTGTGGMGGGY